MTDYKERLGGLADKLRKEPPNVPVQEVLPVKQNKAVREEEVQLNTWIPKTLLKRMKSFGIEHDLSLKALTIDALYFFLGSKDQGKD